MFDKNSLAGKIFSVFTTKIFVLILSFLGSIIIARSVGADGRGLIAAALIYPQILLSLMEGGMRQAATLFVGKKRASDAEVLGALYIYLSIAGIVGTFVTFYLLSLGDSSYSLLSMCLVSAILPFSLATSALRGYFLGKEKIAVFNRLAWVQKIIYFLIILILFFTDQLSVFTVIATSAFVAGINAIQSFLHLRSIQAPAANYKLSTLKSMLAIGWIYALGFFVIVANYKVDILLLDWLSSSAEVGRYSVSVQLGELVWQLPAAVVTIMMSSTANSTVQDFDLTIQRICKATRLTVFITAFSTLGILAFCYFFVALLYGSDFSGVTAIILFLMPGLITATIFKTINSYFAGQGKPHISIFVMGFAVAINILLNFTLIPQMGANGAALASSVSYTIAAIIFALIFKSHAGVSLRNILIPNSSDFKFRRSK